LSNVSSAAEAPLPSFETNPKWVVRIPEGLPGFEKCRRFVLVTSPSLEPVKCLQGVEDNRPSFLGIDPRLAQPEYASKLSSADRRRLELEGDEPLLWLALITVQGDEVFVNLRAPVVINPQKMIGLQVIDPDSTHPTNYRLALA
jgi:flagellar assembly factor FliW